MEPKEDIGSLIAGALLELLGQVPVAVWLAVIPAGWLLWRNGGKLRAQVAKWAKVDGDGGGDERERMPSEFDALLQLEIRAKRLPNANMLKACETIRREWLVRDTVVKEDADTELTPPEGGAEP